MFKESFLAILSKVCMLVRCLGVIPTRKLHFQPPKRWGGGRGGGK